VGGNQRGVRRLETRPAGAGMVSSPGVRLSDDRTCPLDPTAQLRITPPSRRASPVSEGIIEGAATGAPDPIGGHPRPGIGYPAAIPVRPPMRPHPCAVPLAEVTRCSLTANSPRVPARTNAVPHLGNTGRPPGRFHLRSQRIGVSRCGGTQREHSGEANPTIRI
jgi:hypothetical protein